MTRRRPDRAGIGTHLSRIPHSAGTSRAVDGDRAGIGTHLSRIPHSAAGVAVAAVLAVVVLAACGGGAPQWRVAGGEPRRPAAAGVVTDITRTSVTLGDDQTYRFADEIASFSTYTLAPLPLSHRLGQYVHLGLSDDRVTWLATIGVVTRTEPSRVVYTGRYLGAEDGSAVFEDGTVLRLGDGVEAPPEPTYVQVAIDPAANTVVDMSSGDVPQNRTEQS